MTRTIRKNAGPAATGTGVNEGPIGKPDVPTKHETGGRASARRVPSLAPIGGAATRPRSIVIGQFAASDDRMVKLTVNPAGKATTVEIRLHTRSGGLLFPTADGLVLPIAAAAFVGGHLRDIRKTIKKLQEAAQ